MISAFLFVFGAVVGSFLNVCIHRIPLGESVVSPRSRCPSCRMEIAAWDNVPLLSWLWLRGACRNCGTGIPFRYFLVELLTGLLALGVFLRVGLGIDWVVLFVFVAALLVVTFIDLDHRIIPDVISLPGIVIGFAASFLTGPGPWSSGLGILVGGGILWATAELYFRMRGEEGMGGGDVKLLAMMGAFLGWPAIPLILVLSSLAGSVIGITLMWWTGSGSKYAIPFGPFLAIGALVYVFAGEEILAWYIEAAQAS